LVKTLFASFLLLMIAVPALAQDDFPRVELAFGYANLGFPGAPNATTGVSPTEHKSGFSMHQGFNLTSSMGIENYMGYYSLGNQSYIFANIIGGKLMYRTDKVVPYVVAGFGGASITQNIGGFSYGGSTMAYRLGGGFDYRISDVMGWRVDVSKLQIHPNGWLGKMNISTGIVLVLMQ